MVRPQRCFSFAPCCISASQQHHDLVLPVHGYRQEAEHDAASRRGALLRERGHFSPDVYFVEEVITGYDETNLYMTWLQVRGLHRRTNPYF